MEIKTKEFQKICKVIASAATNNATNLSIVAENNLLTLMVANREFNCKCKFELESNDVLNAVVEAKLFVELINGITTETFSLEIDGHVLVVTSGKSKYKLAMVYENDSLIELPVVNLDNKTVEMTVSNEILQSIVNVNGQEIKKIKNIDVDELKKMYYITEDGAFSFSSGACLNNFKLEKPIKLLLNDRIVQLFKLFNSDNVQLCFGYDCNADGQMLAKVTLENDAVFISAITPSNDVLLNKIQGPYAATKNYIKEQYDNHIVLSVANVGAAVNRLLSFVKNSAAKANMLNIPATVVSANNEITITDSFGNTEVLSAENNSVTNGTYTMVLNITDLKSVLDSCYSDFVTLNCGNHRSIVITHGNVDNLIPEGNA